MFGGVGIPELLIVLLLILLFFGARRLPDLAGGLGKGIREFRKGLKGSGEEEANQRTNSSSTSSSKGGQNERGTSQ